MTNTDPQDPYGPQVSSQPVNASTSTLVINGDERHYINREGGRVQYTGRPDEIAPGSPINSAVTESGRRVTGSDITEDSVVSIKGMSMQIKSAMRAGLIERTQDGSFVVVEKGQGSPMKKAPSQDAPSNDDDADMQKLATDVEDAIVDVATNASPGDVLNVLSSVAKGEDPKEAAMGRIASQLGIEPDEAYGRFETIRAGMEKQARQVVSKQGVDPDEVFDWAWKHRPEMMQQAIKAQATQRTTKGYRQIAKAYLENNNPHSADDILNAELPKGVTARKLPNGKVALNVRGVEVEFEQAVRMGWITVNRVR